MLTKFWESLAGKLAEHWSARLFTPALGFWVGGLLTWLFSRPGDLVTNLNQLGRQLAALPIPAQVATLIASLLVLIGSATVADQLTPSVLRLLEGNWPTPIRRWVTARQRRRLMRVEVRLQELHSKANEIFPGDAEHVELRDLQHIVRRSPPADAMMPTRLGNTLRLVETRPRALLGLDTTVCWPYLWMVLRQDTRDQVTESRAAINAAARSWLWGALFAVWSFWSLWAIPVAVIVMCSSYYLRAISAAETYGSMVEAAFVLNREKLFRALGWPKPSDLEHAHRLGVDLTTYLLRGYLP